jgi:putative acetyltransferase
MTTIREETPQDAPLVRRVNELAFEQPQEADLVERLSANCDDLISLVAIDEEVAVGHILFSPATVVGPDGSPIRGMGLAPMAVLPARQRQGIGGALVERGLALLRERGCPFVIVLGHPAYYPRFGFQPASRSGLTSQWVGIPDDVFMAQILDAVRMAGVGGVARYRDEFDDAL